MGGTVDITDAAPLSAAFVTIGNDGTLTGERALTGTANQITVTDGGANSTVTLSLPQDIHTAASPQFLGAELRAGAGAAGTLVLSTAEPTVVADDVLGQIDFQAPDELSAGDAVFVGASIAAVANAEFDGTNNPTDLVFKLAVSEAATERFRFVAENDATATADPTKYGRMTIGPNANNTAALNISTVSDLTTHFMRVDAVSGPTFVLVNASGDDPETPLRTQAGATLGGFNYRGFQAADDVTTATESGNAAIYRVNALEDFTPTARGTRQRFWTTPVGSTTAAVRLELTARGNILTGASSDSGTGTLGIILADGTALSSMAAGTAGFYADDVGGVVASFAIAENDRLTRLTTPFAPLSPQLAETQIDFAETELAAFTGASMTQVGIIPAGSFIVGVTIRVTTTITSGDGGTDFDIGDGTDVDRWGAAIAFGAGTTTTIADFTAAGFGQFTAAGDVVFTCNAGTFNAGAVRITVHYFDLAAATS